MELEEYPKPAILVADLTDDVVEMMMIWKPSWGTRRRKEFGEVKKELMEYMTPPHEDQLRFIEHLLEHYRDLVDIAENLTRPPKIGFWNSLLLLASTKFNTQKEIAKLVAILEECDGPPSNSLFYRDVEGDIKAMCSTHGGLLSLFQRIVVDEEKVKGCIEGAWKKIAVRRDEIDMWFGASSESSGESRISETIRAARSYHTAAVMDNKNSWKVTTTLREFTAKVSGGSRALEENLVYESAVLQESGSIELSVVTAF